MFSYLRKTKYGTLLLTALFAHQLTLLVLPPKQLKAGTVKE